jgi:hypothetical protein
VAKRLWRRSLAAGLGFVLENLSHVSVIAQLFGGFVVPRDGLLQVWLRLCRTFAASLLQVSENTGSSIVSFCCFQLSKAC